MCGWTQSCEAVNYVVKSEALWRKSYLMGVPWQSVLLGGMLYVNSMVPSVILLCMHLACCCFFCWLCGFATFICFSSGWTLTSYLVYIANHLATKFCLASMPNYGMLSLTKHIKFCYEYSLRLVMVVVVDQPPSQQICFRSWNTGPNDPLTCKPCLPFLLFLCLLWYLQD